MYANIVPVLQCPTCAASHLALRDAHESNGEIVAGTLHCATCNSDTRISDGIWDALAGERLPKTPAQITNYLPLAAALYEPTWRWQALSLMSGRRFPLREELTLLRELVQPQPGQVIIDVACSVGLYARTLARAGATVAGIDHSWAMLRQARHVAHQHGVRISYIRASAQALPLADGTAASTTMGGSLNEIGDQQRALNEMARVTQRGGRLFCMNLLRAQSSWGRALQFALSTGGIDFFEPGTFNSWLEAAELQPRAHWRWGVVGVTLARRTSVAPNGTGRL